ncbi:MAG: MoxR family ATPase, partial [Pseudomonadota bacterium]
MTLDELERLSTRIRDEIGRAVHGQDGVIDMLLIALFARGHCLLEGPPGTAKTLLAQSFADALKMDFGRIQFTP